MKYCGSQNCHALRFCDIPEARPNDTLVARYGSRHQSMARRPETAVSAFFQKKGRGVFAMILLSKFPCLLCLWMTQTTSHFEYYSGIVHGVSCHSHLSIPRNPQQIKTPIGRLRSALRQIQDVTACEKAVTGGQETATARGFEIACLESSATAPLNTRHDAISHKSLDPRPPPLGLG